MVISEKVLFLYSIPIQHIYHIPRDIYYTLWYTSYYTISQARFCSQALVKSFPVGMCDIIHNMIVHWLYLVTRTTWPRCHVVPVPLHHTTDSQRFLSDLIIKSCGHQPDLINTINKMNEWMIGILQKILQTKSNCICENLNQNFL